jgi:hypothetical protein
MHASTPFRGLVVDPAFEVLLCCSQLEPGPRDIELLERRLAGTFDWARLDWLADIHGLRPLVFRHLGSGRFGPLPRSFEANLWLHCEQLKRRNRLMEAELQAIAKLLEDEGIPVLVHKGPMLARLAWGDPALREYSDLDVLLPHALIERARQRLATRGYQPLFKLTPALDRALLDSPRHYHLALKRELMVELHWRLDAEFAVGRPEDEAWWAGRPKMRIGDSHLRRLSDEELVLALLLHGSKHLWEQLSWLAELAQLLRDRPNLDWEWITAEAYVLGARRRAALGLVLLERWFDFVPPGSAAIGLERPRLQALAESISRHWVRPGRVAGRSAFDRLAANLNLCDSGRQRARHLVDVVVRPGFEEWSRWPLPRALHPLYLPLRAARLVAKYLGGGARPNH